MPFLQKVVVPPNRQLVLLVDFHELLVWWLEPQASCKLAEHPELPGYVFWDDSQFLQPLPDGHAGMAVQVPFDAGRDLEELAPEERDGTVWLRSRGMWYRRAS